MKKILRSILAVFTIVMLLCPLAIAEELPGIVVFESDFGVKDGAVSAMKGVAMGVSTDLKLFDLTHEIPAYSIWDGAYRLYQTMEYWPEGTVFVSVVDPGVGSERKSIVIKTNSGHYLVTPDNGTATLIAEKFGVAEVREIDEAVNRRQSSGNPYTFHGRDVYAYTGARLASGTCTFEEIGDIVEEGVYMMEYQHASSEANKLMGTIPALDIQYGNIWTNIDNVLAAEAGFALGDICHVEITNEGKIVYSGEIPYVNTYSDVAEGEPLLYFNSLNCLSLAINMDSFSSVHGVSYGNTWGITVTKAQ